MSISIPHIPILGIPKDERDRAWVVGGNLGALDEFVTRFEDAVRVVSYFGAHHAEHAKGRLAVEQAAVTDPTAFPRLSAFNAISKQIRRNAYVGVRDAAMSLGHIRHLMLCIQKGDKGPTLQSLVNQDHLDSILKEFANHFPDAKNVRDAVAHEAQRTSSVEKWAELAGERGNAYSMVNEGKVTIAWKRREATFDCTPDAGAVLRGLQVAIYQEFQPAISALTGKDLGD